MNILIVSQYFWPEEFRINDLVKGLIEKGHHVTILTGQPNYQKPTFYSGYGYFKKFSEKYYDMEVIRVPLIPRASSSSFRLVLNYVSFVLSACMVAPFRCRGNVDMIFVFAPSPITVAIPALLLKKLKKAPVMLWYQDLWPESLSATGAIRSVWILKIVERMVKFIYRGCDYILVQSRAFYEPIEKMRVDKNRIHYLPNSAELLYQPIKSEDREKEKYGIPNGFCVMFAGNVGAAQDFVTILGAAEHLRSNSDIHWLIVGDGRLLPWVKREIDKRKLRDTFHLLGRHPVEAMPKYFSFADVMLVTLKNETIFSFTIPAKVQSYMSCGKPIVAALNGEGARIIREAGAGIATAAENSEKLAESVLRMYHLSDAQRENMGQQGRNYFEAHFERQMLLERLDGWFLEARAGGPLSDY